MGTLADLRRGESTRLMKLLLPPELAHCIMEAGFVPGTLITLMHCAPGGCPRVYRLDGADIAIRRELAASLQVEDQP